MRIKQIILLCIITVPFFSTCKKKNDDSSPENFYFRANVNNDTINVTTGGCSGGGACDSPGAGLRPGMDGYPVVSFAFGNLPCTNNHMSQTDFNNFFHLGNWHYPDTTLAVGEYALVGYTTADNTNYISYKAQPSSSFIIESVEPYTSSAIKIKVRFNCKLYPLAGVGDTLTVTNGEGFFFIGNSYQY